MLAFKTLPEIHAELIQGYSPCFVYHIGFFTDTWKHPVWFTIKQIKFTRLGNHIGNIFGFIMTFSECYVDEIKYEGRLSLW